MFGLGRSRWRGQTAALARMALADIFASFMQVDAARRLVERLLKPLDEEMNEHKRIQVTTQAAAPA